MEDRPRNVRSFRPMSLATKPARQLLPFLATLAIAAVISMTVAAVSILRNLESQNAKAAFDIVAQERFDALKTNVTLTIHSLVSLGAFCDSREIEQIGR